MYPKHVAIIMDGNGRWAKKFGKSRVYGHEAGIKSVNMSIFFSIRNNIDILTLYAFSSENWFRPKYEIVFLMDLFLNILNDNIVELNNNNVKLNIIGDKSCFTKNLIDVIIYCENLTKNNNGLLLNLAINYGGKWDITQCFKKLLLDNSSLRVNDINENLVSKYVCLSDLHPVDLVIRTGGEYRISNFLLWQIAYSELYFTDVLWPDFTYLDFEKALVFFSNRNRRFGR